MPSTENYITQAAADARYQALGGLSSSTPTQVDAGDSGTAGVSSSASRADHEHPVAITSEQLVPTGAWTAYVPSSVNVTVGNGTQTARYVQMGKTVHFEYTLTFGTTTTFGGTVEIGIPVTAASTGALAVVGASLLLQNGSTHTIGTAFLINTSRVRVQPPSSTVQVSNTVPFTWGDLDTLAIRGTYEAA